MMKITVIGSGYVGLVAGACFASRGIKVCCVDKDLNKINLLSSGKIHIHEPGLEEIVAHAISSKHISFAQNLDSIHDSDAIFLAVGTPSSETGEADISGVIAAAEEIAEIAKRDTILVTKSTVPVGTAKKLQDLLKAKRSDIKFSIVSNPEFLREGSAVKDFLQPDRIVLGCTNSEAMEVLKNIYAPITAKDIPVLCTDNQTAELIKYASNSYLAMRIAFINEIADLCENIGADVEEVATGMGYDARIGRHYLHAGPGYGGSCFPKDTLAISHFANSINCPLNIVNTVIKSNDERKERIAKRITAKLKAANIKTVAVLGLAFKTDTDDMRESISLNVIPQLIEAGFIVKAFDPSHPLEAKALWEGKITFTNSTEEALNNAEVAVILTEWSEFKLLQPKDFINSMQVARILDMRNLYSAKKMKAAGIDYSSIGRV